MRVFLSYASVERTVARDLERRLGAMGIACWLDEAALLPGDPFPERLTAALRDATHLLVLLTPAWLGSHWGRRELVVFLELAEDRKERVIAVVPEKIPRQDLPTELRERTLLDAADCTPDEVDWLLACSLSRNNPGTRDRWGLRARQVRLERGPVPDFHPGELRAAGAQLLGTNAEPGPLGRNIVLHCVRQRLSPGWLEHLWTPEALVEMYMGALQALPESDLPAVWTRLALAAEAAGERPCGLSEDALVQAATTAADEAVSVAALRILGLAPLSGAAVRAVTRWLDPDAGGGLSAMDRPQARGHHRAVETALAVLLAQEEVDPLALFRGPASALFAEQAWLCAYYRAILRRAAEGRLPWAGVRDRIHLGVEAGAEEPEELAAICEAIGELPALPRGLEGAAQATLAALRFRRREPWATRALRLCELLLPRVPRVVLLRLGPALTELGTWGDAHRAARLAGLAAQEAADVEELLARLARAIHPEERALLFEAALGSPADVTDVEQALHRVAAAAGVQSPTAHGVATLLSGAALRALQATVESDSWQAEAPVFLRGQPLLARELWPYVLGREVAHGEGDPGGRWTRLSRCIRLLAQDIADAAAVFVGADDRLAAPFLTLEEAAFIDAWDEATGLIARLGADLPRRADELQAQLRWLQTGLQAAGPAVRGKLRLLESRLRAWFVAHADLALTLTARPSTAFRHAVSTDPTWVAVRILLTDQEVSDALRKWVYPRLSASASSAETVIRSVEVFERADAARSVAHRLCAMDELLAWAVDLLRVHPSPEADGVLWALLLRKHGYRSPAAPEHERHTALVGAVVTRYQENVPALRETVSGLLVDAETRAELATAAYRAAPAEAENWLLETLGHLIHEGGETSVVVAGLGALAAGPPSERSVPTVRAWAAALGDRTVTAHACAALVNLSDDPADTLRGVDFALRDPHLAAPVNDALERAVVRRRSAGR